MKQNILPWNQSKKRNLSTILMLPLNYSKTFNDYIFQYTYRENTKKKVQVLKMNLIGTRVIIVERFSLLTIILDISKSYFENLIINTLYFFRCALFNSDWRTTNRILLYFLPRFVTSLWFSFTIFYLYSSDLGSDH